MDDGFCSCPGGEGTLVGAAGSFDVGRINLSEAACYQSP